MQECHHGMMHSSDTKIIGLEVAGPKEAHCYS